MPDYDIVVVFRPVEEQLKQRVMAERYCISRKRKSYKGSTSRSRLVKCLVRNEKLSSPSELGLGEYALVGRVHLWGMVGYVPIKDMLIKLYHLSGQEYRRTVNLRLPTL